MKFENTDVWGFEHALRIMHNSKESWDKSDSFNCHEGMGDCERCPFFIDNHQYTSNECQKESELDEKNDVFIIGENDLELAQALIKEGSDQRKFICQIFVSVDITAPLYWWKEFDKYKNTVVNSYSTMYELANAPITTECFEMDDFEDLYPFRAFGKGGSGTRKIFELLLTFLEELRLAYNETKDKRYWKELIRLLPESWLQKRTVIMSYENILNMYQQRGNIKLNEWSGKDDPTKTNFCKWALNLPYAEQLFVKPFEKQIS